MMPARSRYGESRGSVRSMPKQTESVKRQLAQAYINTAAHWTGRHVYESLTMVWVKPLC